MSGVRVPLSALYDKKLYNMISIAKLLLAFYLDPPLIRSESLLSKERLINIGYLQFVTDVHCFICNFNFFEDYLAIFLIMNSFDINPYSNTILEKNSLLFYYFFYLEYHSDIIFQYCFFDEKSLNTNYLITFFQALDYTSKDEDMFEWNKYIF